MGAVAVQCRTYTHARRFPMVIGKIGGYALPTPLTPAQVGVLISTVIIEVSTRQVWAVLPGSLDLIVAMALPVALAWAVRHARVEGRSPSRYAVGLLTYLTRPRRGVRNGRAVRDVRPVRHRARAGAVS